MDEKTARKMDRLLAGGELSGPEADAILERVLEQVGRKEKRPARVMQMRYWAGAALAAAAAVLLFVNVPSDVVQQEEGVLGPAIEVSCSGGTLAACPISSSLVFKLSGGRSGFLSAYAEPLGSAAEPIFYFSKEGSSIELAVPPDATRRSERAVRLGASQRPGRYRVHAFLADRPLGREEMRKGVGGTGISATARIELVVVD